MKIEVILHKNEFLEVSEKEKEEKEEKFLFFFPFGMVKKMMRKKS